MKWTPGAALELLIVCLIAFAVMAEPRALHVLIGQSADRQLLDAAIQGNPGGIDDALQNGAAPNAKDQSGNTPLIHAILSRQLPCASTLLDHGANPNALSAVGLTPLMLAAQLDDAAMIRMLLARGADPQLRSPQSHFTALQVAQHAEAPRAVAALRPCARPHR